jgi:hypothetical protein
MATQIGGFGITAGDALKGQDTYCRRAKCDNQYVTSSQPLAIWVMIGVSLAVWQMRCRRVRVA